MAHQTSRGRKWAWAQPCCAGLTARLSTIIEVRPDGSFDVRADKAIRIDSYGMSDCQSYEYQPDEYGLVYTFAPVKRGKKKGQIRQNGQKDGYSVLVGVRNHYHDYSF